MPGQDQALRGELFVNGKLIGKTIENARAAIPSGHYKGVVRSVSAKNLVQNPFGVLATRGDFLLEVSGVAKRKHILFHAGAKPKNSTGCVLLGAVDRNPSSLEIQAKPAHPLRLLRAAFYGTEQPLSTPYKVISIAVVDTPGSRSLSAPAPQPPPPLSAPPPQSAPPVASTPVAAPPAQEIHEPRGGVAPIDKSPVRGTEPPARKESEPPARKQSEPIQKEITIRKG